MLEGIQRCMSRERRVAIAVLLEIGSTMHDFESELPTCSRQAYVQVVHMQETCTSTVRAQTCMDGIFNLV